MSIIIHNTTPYCTNNFIIGFSNQTQVSFILTKIFNIHL